MIENKKVVEMLKVYGCTSEALEEDYYVLGDGVYGCDRIEYHEPKGTGDRHYCDVYKDKKVYRIFEPTKIEFE